MYVQEEINTMSQSQISKRIRDIVQNQMKKHGVTYEDIQKTMDEYKDGK